MSVHLEYVQTLILMNRNRCNQLRNQANIPVWFQITLTRIDSGGPLVITLR